MGARLGDDGHETLRFGTQDDGQVGSSLCGSRSGALAFADRHSGGLGNPDLLVIGKTWFLASKARRNAAVEAFSSSTETQRRD